MSDLPEQITINLPGKVPMPFQLIVDEKKEVEFQMGARGKTQREEPIHRVVINQPYYLGVTPVTQAQYRAMAEKCLDQLEKIKGNKGIDPSDFSGKDQHPVEQVDWRDAEAICKWLTGFKDFREKLPPNWKAGLLVTEAQWEYACRAGTDTEYYTGDGEAALTEAGWFGEERGEGGTHPVGSPEKKRNDFGLSDLHGNVWEWCCDVFDPLAYAKRESGWIARLWTDADAGNDADNQFSNDDSSHRVLRGGSWGNSASDCRSAFRLRLWAGFRDRSLGFRVCLFPGPDDSQPE